MDPVYDDISGGLTTAGSANAYTLTTNQAFMGYYQGLWIKAKVHASNTAASTLNVNGVGDAAIKTTSGADPSTGQLIASGVYDFVHDGSTGFLVLNPSPSASALLCTATNDNAAAGKLGEIITSNVAAGSAVTLTSGTPSNVTSISLTAGDWDVYGFAATNPAGTTTITSILCGISQTSANLGSFVSKIIGLSGVAGQSNNLPAATQRISLASTTTVYLVAQANFAVSTCGAYGYITARRAR